MKAIKRVAVLGSGVMGSGIAAHLANCGIQSLMLDIVPPNLSAAESKDKASRDAFAERSKKALLKAKPAPLYLNDYADLIETGNIEDDMPRIAECDWVIEVVKEDLAVKRSIFQEVAKHRKPGTIVSTNTSGVPLHQMVGIMDADMRKHFLGTHFFNPPRYLNLLEIIVTKDTAPDVVRTMAAFAEDVLGKGVVYAKDTPNFIANRILTFSAQWILHNFLKHGLTVEDVDNLTGPNIGHASSATFRTLDLVGLDTYVHVVGNVAANCPDDERRDVLEIPEYLRKMIDQGLIGQKAGAGFYKRTDERDERGKAIINSIDVNSLEYTPQNKQKFGCIGVAKGTDSLAGKIKAMHTAGDPGAQFTWELFANMAIYSANRVPEIADDIVNIDNALKWGFAWQVGLFETWDLLGFTDVCDRMKQEGFKLPPIAKAILDAGGDGFYKVESGVRYYFDLASYSYKPVPQNDNEIRLPLLKDSKGVVRDNENASLADLGDGILCCEFHSKMNTIDAQTLKMLHEGVEMVNNGAFEGLVVANQGEHFSAGANLFLILGEIMQGNWDKVELAARQFQDTNMAMRFCRGPVVAAPHHYTFGGGVEISQHTGRIVYAGETYAGLVEAGVGIIPAGGGTKEMLRRALAYVPSTVSGGDPFPYVRRAFESIGMAKVATSGPETVQLGYFSESDVLCVNFDHQVKRAKDVCRGMVVAGYTPPQPAILTALGEPAQAAFRSGVYQLQLGGYASEHDALIAEHLGHILTGGGRAPGTKMTEQDVLDLECEAFCSLCGTEKTQARMSHMLQTGKPLRN